MKIGARILKTGIALVIAIYITTFLGLEPVIFTSIAAALAVQRSIYRSWQYGVEQIQANLVGATIAMLFVYYIGTHPIAVAIAIMLVIGINLQLHFERSIALAIVTVLSIMEGDIQQADFFFFALDRFLLILIGLLSALVVNTFLFPPKYDQRIGAKLKHIEEQTTSLLRIILDRERNERSIHAVLQQLDEEMENLRDLFDLEKERRSNFKRKLPFTSSRKLVILKAMIDLSEFAIDLFHMINKYQNAILKLPKPLFDRFYDQLHDIANYQDKIYSKFEGRILSSRHHNQNETLQSSYSEFFDNMTKEAMESNITLDTLTILTMVREYYKKLDHLEKLIDSYQTFHSKEKHT